MNLESSISELSSNTGFSHALWAPLTETSNSLSLGRIGVRHREALKVLTAASIACINPASANVEPIFDQSDVTHNKSVISASVELVTFTPNPGVFDVRETYPLVRRVFSGTVAQTASFYGVSRKTLYQWLGNDDVPRIREKQLKRAVDLYKVARHAESTLGEVGGLLTHKVGQHSLVDLLSSPEIDVQEVFSWLNDASSLKVKNRASQNRDTLAKRLEATGAKPPPGEDGLEPLL